MPYFLKKKGGNLSEYYGENSGGRKNLQCGRSASGEKSGRGGRTVFQPENCFQKSFWRQPLKLTGVLAAAVVLIFSMTLTSEGNRMYWLGRWRGLFGYDDVEQSNNGGDRIQTETSEQEAREQAWEELGIAMPEFYYVPEDMKFESATLDTAENRVVFEYRTEEEYIYLTAIKNDTEAAVQSRNPNGIYIQDIKAGANGDSIEVLVVEDTSGGEDYSIYKGKWVYQNCNYEIGNITEESDLIKILENMQYVQ